MLGIWSLALIDNGTYTRIWFESLVLTYSNRWICIFLCFLRDAYVFLIVCRFGILWKVAPLRGQPMSASTFRSTGLWGSSVPARCMLQWDTMRYLWMVQYLHGFLLHHRSKQMTKETGARQEDGISSLEDGISSVPSNRGSLWCVLSRSSVEMSCKLQLHQNSDFRQYFNFLYLNVALRTLRVKDGYKWLPTHRSAFPND